MIIERLKEDFYVKIKQEVKVYFVCVNSYKFKLIVR